VERLLRLGVLWQNKKAISAVQNIWTNAEPVYRISSLKPANLLLPSARFSFFAFTAIAAGALLALVI
jgi:hypothetical protein